MTYVIIPKLFGNMNDMKEETLVAYERYDLTRQINLETG
jgi:hypothetical protein